MIATLTGKIDSVSGESCVINVNGVGYLVMMPLSALETLSHKTELVTIFTHYYLREDFVGLYGFLNQQEKSVFEKIINVSGVGPKLALGILGYMSSQDFSNAIARGEHQLLTKIPGIGLKTAQRLVLELKGKLSQIIGISDAENNSSQVSLADSNQLSDAVDALMALGYPVKEATRLVDNLVNENGNLTTPEIVRKALKKSDRK